MHFVQIVQLLVFLLVLDKTLETIFGLTAVSRNPQNVLHRDEPRTAFYELVRIREASTFGAAFASDRRFIDTKEFCCDLHAHIPFHARIPTR